MAPEDPERLSFGASALVCIAAVATSAAIVFLVVYSRPPRLTTRPRDAFCCPGLLQPLWSASNLSIDPCRDFYRYTCYNWDRTEILSRNEKATLQHLYIPTYTQSRSRSLASRTISRYYRDCVGAISDWDYGLAAAVRALLDVLRPSASPTPSQMFQLLSRVTIVYGMSPGITVLRIGRQYVKYALPERNIDGWVAQEKISRRVRGLALFNDMMSSNVTWRDVQELATSGFLEGVPVDVTESNSSVLADIVPHVVGLEEWKRTWERYTSFQLPTSVSHSNVSQLKKYFSAIVRGPQPAALALLVLEASIRSWESLWRDFGEVTFGKWQKKCEKEAHRLRLLWDIVAMEAFTDPHKDSVVRSVYTKLSDQVLKDSASLFPPGNVGVMRRKILQMKLLLASDMHLRDIEPPVNASGYWRRKLALKDHTVTVRRHQRRLGLPYYVYGVFPFSLARCGFTTPGHVIVSPALYVALNFTPGAETLLNMAVAGSGMTCQWRMIMWDTSDYSVRTASVLNDYKACMGRENLLGTRRLRVETAASASRGANWQKPIFAWSPVPLSRGRIFYMSYVLNNVCKGWSGAERGAFYTTDLLMSMPDFRETFACPPLSAAVQSSYCYLNSSL